ncbi:hypothetical protein M0802_000771 [Mischocyttarus mexicanus]|nr:hypothetical protein M0802_000771 [Mischocyttarus mexicanus]
MISTFSGDDNAEIKNWLIKYEVVAFSCGWSDLQRVVYCKRMLRGSARKFIRSKNVCFSWEQLSSFLYSKYGFLDISTLLENQLQIEVKKPSKLEQFYKKKNNPENSFILKTTKTIRELQEDFAICNSINRMKNLKL